MNKILDIIAVMVVYYLMVVPVKAVNWIIRKIRIAIKALKEQ